MHKEPQTIEQVNNNLIELKKQLIALKGKKSEQHIRYHKERIKTPLSEIKEVEIQIEQMKELISIAELQKENLSREDIITSLKGTVIRLRKELNKYKSLKQ